MRPRLGIVSLRPNLFFGPAVLRREGTDELVRQGITAVLCLQTDGDLAEYGRQWSDVEEWYVHRRIVTRRVPIRDFSADAIAERLDEALTTLAALLQEGHTVYLHCSAGLNRSPTVAIAYLIRSEGLALAEALDAVSAAAPTIQPYLQALNGLVPGRRA